MRKSTAFLLSTMILASCADIHRTEVPDNHGKDVEIIKPSKPVFIFGFGSDRYSYCPSALVQEDGTTEIWFCGNPNSGIMVDNVYHITEEAYGIVSDPVSVLQPSLSWDSHHTCDPSVIEGDFKMDGKKYRYAMFFLSNPLDVYYNEIGVAFSNDLKAVKWDKYPEQIIRKTWDDPGDQNLGGGNRSWGVGQPSAFSLDKKGKVCLTYTIGDVGGTRVAWRECDFSDMSSYSIGPLHTVSTAGLEGNDGKPEGYLCNVDFAVNLEEDVIVMAREPHPHDSGYPAFIAPATEVDYMSYKDFLADRGGWKKMFVIDSNISGFPRNHNSCIARDNFGHIKDWQTPTVYFTVSKTAPDVAAQSGRYAEWTYHIYKTTLTRRVIKRQAFRSGENAEHSAGLRPADYAL